MIAAVVAVDNNWGIGYKDNLLAHIPEDMKMFKSLTSGHTVIVGRKTFDTFPKKPLPNRKNIVVTKDKCGKQSYGDDVVYSTLEEAKLFIKANKNDNVFIIGGSMIYKELLPFCDTIYLTRIYKSFDNVDTYFPNIDETKEWTLSSLSDVKTYGDLVYLFCKYERVVTTVMEMKCKAVCTKIKNKSSSSAFKNLQVGDIIEFSVPIKRAGSGGRGTYATYITCLNTRTNQISKLSFNQISRTLDNFEFEECK